VSVAGELQPGGVHGSGELRVSGPQPAAHPPPSSRTSTGRWFMNHAREPTATDRTDR
jgi:hypothetical protein